MSRANPLVPQVRWAAADEEAEEQRGTKIMCVDCLSAGVFIAPQSVVIVEGVSKCLQHAWPQGGVGPI